MAQFQLIGRLDKDNLWLVNHADKTACPIPREVWEDVIAMFQTESLSASAVDHERRKDIAAKIIAAAERGERDVNISLAANDLGKIMLAVRFTPIERELDEEGPLAELLRQHVEWDMPIAA